MYRVDGFHKRSMCFCERKLIMICKLIPEDIEFKVVYVSCRNLKDGSAGPYKLECTLSIDLFALPTVFLHLQQVIQKNGSDLTVEKSNFGGVVNSVQKSFQWTLLKTAAS